MDWELTSLQGMTSSDKSKETAGLSMGSSRS